MARNHGMLRFRRVEVVIDSNPADEVEKRDGRRLR